MVFVRVGHFQLSRLNDYKNNAQNYLTKNELQKLSKRTVLAQAQSLIARELIYQQLSVFNAGIYQFETRVVDNCLNLYSEMNCLPYRCSISHSGEWAAVAVSPNPGVSLGVDIEKAKPGRDFVAMAKVYFSDAEYMKIMSSPTKESAFYTLWTLKEAYAKAKQKGLWDVLSSCVELEVDGLHSKQVHMNDVYLTCVTEEYNNIEFKIVDL